MSNITSDCQESLLKILPYMVKIKLSWNAVCCPTVVVANYVPAATE